MNKKLIVPIVALIVLLSKESLGVEFDSKEIDVIVEGLLAISVVFGIFTNPKR